MARTIEQRLQALHDKRTALQQQIEQLEREQSKELRKRQEKRERLVGKVIYALIKSGEWTEQQLLDLVAQHLVRASERRLFGLPVLTDTVKTLAAKKGKSATRKAPKMTALEKAPKEDTEPLESKAEPEEVAGKTTSRRKSNLPEVNDEDALMKEFNL